VLVIRSQGRRKRPWPAEQLKPRWNLQKIQVRMIAAARTDELERARITAVYPAIYDAHGLAPHEGCPAMPWLTG
jgi:hypothetical protein